MYRNGIVLFLLFIRDPVPLGRKEWGESFCYIYLVPPGQLFVLSITSSVLVVLFPLLSKRDRNFSILPIFFELPTLLLQLTLPSLYL